MPATSLQATISQIQNPLRFCPEFKHESRQSFMILRPSPVIKSERDFWDPRLEVERGRYNIKETRYCGAATLPTKLDTAKLDTAELQQ